jgi:hypothetical protein
VEKQKRGEARSRTSEHGRIQLKVLSTNSAVIAPVSKYVTEPLGALTLGSYSVSSLWNFCCTSEKDRDYF